ncbi:MULTISPECIES: acetolactate synthase small subunit [Vagococcus]|uniref:acetolactate synthase small subunit n=1 Tax=Vagococcus TaxID=2737 RepID=UPI000E47A64D|nr:MULTISPECIES: acetolactate synthase small subunit [Vagococcus]RHH70209.1 acetolactate synthase small subunit [Vagococcus sp. AM17-17]
MRRIISAKVRNTSGVLNRISGVLTRRQFNIESISVGVTENPDVSRITIVVSVDLDFQMEQLIKQLNKQIDVIKVIDMSADSHLERELALIKVATTSINRQEIMSMIEPFRASVIDVSSQSIIIQIAGSSEKIDALVDVLKVYGIQELARTGITGLLRSSIK